jgi:hypothetical protein
VSKAVVEGQVEAEYSRKQSDHCPTLRVTVDASSNVNSRFILVPPLHDSPPSPNADRVVPAIRRTQLRVQCHVVASDRLTNS